MTPVQRPLHGPVLHVLVTDEMRIIREQLGSGSRIARTLVKSGPLRAILIGLAPGGTLAPHSAEGPVTMQIIEGEVEFEADGRRWPLTAGSMLALDGGVEHGGRSATGGIFLLTVVGASS